jgi:hypothetical protein
LPEEDEMNDQYLEENILEIYAPLKESLECSKCGKTIGNTGGATGETVELGMCDKCKESSQIKEETNSFDIYVLIDSGFQYVARDDKDLNRAIETAKQIAQGRKWYILDSHNQSQMLALSEAQLPKDNKISDKNNKSKDKVPVQAEKPEVADNPGLGLVMNTGIKKLLNDPGLKSYFSDPDNFDQFSLDLNEFFANKETAQTVNQLRIFLLNRNYGDKTIAKTMEMLTQTEEPKDKKDGDSDEEGQGNKEGKDSKENKKVGKSLAKFKIVSETIKNTNDPELLENAYNEIINLVEKDTGIWKTINGNHVEIDKEGNIVKGPKAIKNSVNKEEPKKQKSSDTIPSKKRYK